MSEMEKHAIYYRLFLFGLSFKKKICSITWGATTKATTKEPENKDTPWKTSYVTLLPLF